MMSEGAGVPAHSGERADDGHSRGSVSWVEVLRWGAALFVALVVGFGAVPGDE